ncbi:Divergent PAP2 family [Delftia tsuruhatensis]|uniref:divergent PAP2 family protein n=1 Tax=Delftia tsuruhatensis TaxID=180282 RepID=UPI001E706037|nr:divergent PAP2 family protein [Delftia tsuruhatensis]CAB5701096.1 Divergent PAP2 family [Delftia tsuruhatensis]CAC9693401.1 Divergent PAP2 family [Delftia tsuruhatensis]
MSYSYAVTPLLAWLVAGAAKFLINSLNTRRFAFDLIGYGGLPSNHSAIVCSMATLIALKEGLDHPAFGVAITLAFIVMLDANSLRRQIGKQAKAINELAAARPHQDRLRERMGHTRAEIAAGALTGFIVAISVERLLG